MSRAKSFFNQVSGSMSIFPHEVILDAGSFQIKVWSNTHESCTLFPSQISLQGESMIMGLAEESVKIHQNERKNIRQSEPFCGGGVRDVYQAAYLINHAVSSALQLSINPRNSIIRPVISFLVNPQISEVQLRAFRLLSQKVHAVNTTFLLKPLIDVLGNGVDLRSQEVQLIIDSGHRQTCFSLVKAGQILSFLHVSVGGLAVTTALQRRVRMEHHLEIGIHSATEVKQELSDRQPKKNIKESEHFAVVRGKDIISGSPKTVKLSSIDMQIASSEVNKKIIQHLLQFSRQIESEFLDKIVRQGITLVGGNARVWGLKNELEQAMGSMIHTPQEVFEKGAKAYIDQRKSISELVKLKQQS